MKIKDIAILIILVVGGFYAGRFAMGQYRGQQVEDRISKLTEIIGPKKEISQEQRQQLDTLYQQSFDLLREGRMDSVLATAEEMKQIDAWDPRAYVVYANTGLDIMSTLKGFNIVSDDLVAFEKIESNVAIVNDMAPKHYDVLELNARFHNFLGVNAMNRQAEELSQKHFEAALNYLNEATKLYGQDERRYTDLLLSKSKILTRQGEVDKALDYIDVALGKESAKGRESRIYHLKALALAEKGDYKEALKAINTALDPKWKPVEPESMLIMTRINLLIRANYLYAAEEDLELLTKRYPKQSQFAEMLKELKGKIENDSKNDTNPAPESKVETP